MPLTWAGFKIFLQKSFEKTRVFVDDIWRKFHNTNKYQLEDIMDKSVHIEHFLSIMKQFETVVALTGNLLI